MGIPIGSGSSDPQARNSSNVRSKPTVLPKYDPPATIARDWAARQTLQFNNADKGEAAKYATEYALGQISEWQAHVRRDQTLSEKISFEGWLNGNAKSFFEQLENERNIKTKAAIAATDRRYKKYQEPGYQEPGPRIPNEEGIDAAQGEVAPAFIDPDERALNSFCAKRSWDPTVVEHARRELRTFRAYKARSRTELTFADWIRFNQPPRQKRRSF